MIQVNEIAFVGTPTRDRANAGRFYGELLGVDPALDMDMGEHFWTEYEIGSSTFAVSNYWEPAAEPSMGPTIALEVGDFEAATLALETADVTILERHESPVCFMSRMLDPDGNSFWIHKRKGAPTSPKKVLDIPFICYPVTDRQRACDFWEGTFGLTRTQPDHVAPDGFWSEYNIGAGTLAICNFWKPSSRPSMGPVIALELEDFDTAVAELKAANIFFPREPMETPGCFLAVILDSEGNSLFIHKRKPKN